MKIKLTEKLLDGRTLEVTYEANVYDTTEAENAGLDLEALMKAIKAGLGV